MPTYKVVQTELEEDGQVAVTLCLVIPDEPLNNCQTHTFYLDTPEDAPGYWVGRIFQLIPIIAHSRAGEGYSRAAAAGFPEHVNEPCYVPVDPFEGITGKPSRNAWKGTAGIDSDPHTSRGD